MSRLVVCAPAGVVHGAHRQRLVCKHSRVSEEMCGASMQLVARGSRVPARTAGRSPVIFSIAHARYMTYEGESSQYVVFLNQELWWVEATCFLWFWSRSGILSDHWSFQSKF